MLWENNHVFDEVVTQKQHVRTIEFMKTKNFCNRCCVSQNLICGVTHVSRNVILFTSQAKSQLRFGVKTLVIPSILYYILKLVQYNFHTGCIMHLSRH